MMNKTPVAPKQGDELRKWISYRSQTEIGDFLKRSGLTIRELSDKIGLHESTLGQVARGVRDRIPTSEMLNILDSIDKMNDFEKVPRREISPCHVDVLYIVTGRRSSALNNYAIELKNEITDLKEKLMSCEGDVIALKRTISLMHVASK